MTIRVVLADANILYSRTLRDYFLYAADAGAIEIRWNAAHEHRPAGPGEHTPVALCHCVGGRWKTLLP